MVSTSWFMPNVRVPPVLGAGPDAAGTAVGLAAATGAVVGAAAGAVVGAATGAVVGLGAAAGVGAAAGALGWAHAASNPAPLATPRNRRNVRRSTPCISRPRITLMSLILRGRGTSPESRACIREPDECDSPRVHVT